jgi:hypothetical protein
MMQKEIHVILERAAKVSKRPFGKIKVGPVGTLANLQHGLKKNTG